jgi:uncharacterized protein
VLDCHSEVQFSGGVGNSGGSFSEGIGEQDDVKAALDFLSALKAIDTKRIGLVGYSFGGFVAASVAARDNSVKQLVLISPGLKEMDWVQLKDYALPKLILIGDTAQYQIIPEADHLWWGFEEEISGRVARFFHDGFQGK